jgi:hypothetical protein
MMTLGIHEVQRRTRWSTPRKASDGADAAVPILRSGILAQEFCRRAARAEVVAVFARSFYLRSDHAFACVGESAIGNGPLTLVAGTAASRRFADLGLRPGQPVSISNRRIVIGDLIRFTLESCEAWRPPRWPIPQPHARLIGICATLARQAALEASPDGLGRLALGGQECDVPETPLARIARPRIAGFRSWLYGTLNSSHSLAAGLEPQALIGLGPGLTPAGDDFLVGALALLDAVGEVRVHMALARAIAGASPASTSPLSSCFLQAAAIGHVGEHLHRAVSSVIGGNVPGAIAAAGNIGHSSGWDMLAGVATTLRIVAASRLNA